MMYEHVSILKGNLTKEEVKNEITRYKEYLKEHDVRLTKLEDKGLKKLAYEIGNNTEGYYLLFQFSCDPSRISDVERFARINDSVLKFITLKLDERELGNSENIFKELSKLNESYLYKGVADCVLTQLENDIEDGRNIEFDIDDVKEITEKILDDDFFLNNFTNMINDSIIEKFPELDELENNEEI